MAVFLPVAPGVTHQNCNSARSRRREVKTSEAIFHQGDLRLTLYLVLSGCVNLQCVASFGELIHLTHRSAVNALRRAVPH